MAATARPLTAPLSHGSRLRAVASAPPKVDLTSQLSPRVREALVTQDVRALERLSKDPRTATKLAPLLESLTDAPAVKVLVGMLASAPAVQRGPFLRLCEKLSPASLTASLTEVTFTGDLQLFAVADWLERLSRKGADRLLAVLPRLGPEALGLLASAAQRADRPVLERLLAALERSVELSPETVGRHCRAAGLSLVAQEAPPMKRKPHERETEAEWRRGIRHPYGVLVQPKAISAALAATHGAVQVRSTPFPGTRLFFPAAGSAAGKGQPAIFLLHGSEGGAAGLNEAKAVAWAKRGYAVMTYAYYGAEGTPTRLAEISLDQAIEAMRWFKGSPQVRQGPLALMGLSRGAELAVLLASLLGSDPLVSAVVAHAPQDAIQPNLDVKRRTLPPAVDTEGRELPTWMYRGQPLARGTPIALERFGRPVFLSQSLTDDVWSPDGTLRLERRLEARGQRPQVWLVPNQPHIFDGEAERQANAARERFLREALAQP